MKEALTAFVGIIGVMCGFFLNYFYECAKNRKESKQILAVINNEIWENSFALIKPTKSYFDSLKTDAKSVVNSKIGSLHLPIAQLQSILEIYNLFERIKFRMIELREGKTDSNGLPKSSYDLDELSSRCRSMIYDYQKKWDKKNLIIKK
jgi:hypothetical protein